MTSPAPPLSKSLLLTGVLMAGLCSSHRHAQAQAPTFVGAFAITNGKSDLCLENTSPGLGGSGYPTDTQAWIDSADQQWGFIRLSDGFYAIFNLKTGLFLGAGGLGAGVGQSAWTAAAGQMWYLYPLGDHFYALVNAGNSGVLQSDGPFSTPITTRWDDTIDEWWYLYFLFE